MKAETYIRVLFGILFACTFVGCHNDIENEIKSFMTQRIDMPYQEMERKICSKFYDNRVSSNAIFIVNYIKLSKSEYFTQICIKSITNYSFRYNIS